MVMGVLAKIFEIKDRIDELEELIRDDIDSQVSVELSNDVEINVFDEALAHTLEIEGGLSDRDLIADPGGLTNLGITQKTLDSFNRRHPEYNLPRSVIDLKTIDAKIIYKIDYWNVCHCDQLPAPAAILIFDMAVNAGPARSKKLMQKTLGVVQDGIIGPKTLGAISEYDQSKFISYFSMYRLEFYTSLSNWKHNIGWARRVVDSAIFAHKFI
jgi:lysozyme family protein